MPGELQRTLELDPAIQVVEVKITAQVDNEALVRAALERSGEEPEHRKVYFFDTASLRLFDAGVVLRARVVRGDADDSTVKLRPVDPARLDAAWKQTDGFELELDGVGERLICSAKLSVGQRREEIDQVAAGRRPLRKLFSAAQEQLVGEHGPGAVGWEDLVVLGPVAVRKWKVEPEGFGDEIVAEEWTLPDGSDLIELSIKVPPSRAGRPARLSWPFWRRTASTPRATSRPRPRRPSGSSPPGSASPDRSRSDRRRALSRVERLGPSSERRREPTQPAGAQPALQLVPIAARMRP
jgi:hypothetical protein